MHNIKISPEILERSRLHRERARIIDSIDMSRAAHLIVDMQNGFLEPGAAVEIPLAREIVDNVNQISAAVRHAGGLNVFLRFTYDEAEPVNWSVWYDTISGKQAKQRSRDAFTPGAHGHALWPELDVDSGSDVVMDKTRFSGFVPRTCRLDKLLGERGIETVIITGTMTNCCSESTARDAAQRNYAVVFVADGNATLTDAEHNATLNNIQALFGEVLTTQQTLSLIAARQASQDAIF